MLQLLKIKNFALIADQTIEFKQGFNVLIGETGAGKSLILDALSFVLGEKANKLNIRHGEQKMLVQAVFDSNKTIETFLNENDIQVDDELIITRSLTIEGKSDCRINGTIVSTSTLKAIASIMVDTYAQNENVELLKVKNHISILDAYCKEQITDLKLQVNECLNKIKEIDATMQKLGGDNKNRERELELLDYQIKDIENANLTLGEDEDLRQQIDKLSNAEKIFEGVQMSTAHLNVAIEKISQCQQSIAHISKFDPKLEEQLQRIKSTKIELQDVLDSLELAKDNGYDQNEIDNLNKRYDEIKLLKKKYGSGIEDILQYLSKIKEDYNNLLYSEEKLNTLTKQKNDLTQKLYKASKTLSQTRRECAKAVENKVICELAQLGFLNCKFKVYFKDIPDIENATYTKNGLDEIEFLFSANAGEELKSLSKTISGGEMSRFMLAIKNVFADCFETSTLVFDEVDTGISGETGQKVAERLAKLSKKYQLICITHLCQVSAMADNYIYVKKEVKDEKTYTTISYLDNQKVIEYIATVSGAQPTQVAISFASELKQKANAFKNSL